MIGYKLTDQNLQTYGGFQWELNQTETTDGKGELCGPGWLHYYKSPLLAVLHNPIHAAIKQPRLFRVEAAGEHKHNGDMKSGCTQLTLLEELPLPEITPIQRTAYGILCAKAVCTDPAWTTWADSWLDGTDRSAAAAWAWSWAAVWAAAARAARAAARATEAAALDLQAIAERAMEVA
jgi:hypothetical protein